jgi:SAM-dependent methyltransferase
MVIRRGAELLVDAMARNFRGRVLDIGCGAKSKRHLLPPAVTEYVGVDHEGTLHDLSKADLVGTAYEIPAPDTSFDGVLCTAVLEHLEEPARALGEAFRVLRPGGRAVYTVPLFWYLHEEPRDFFRYTEHGLRHLFTGAGFTDIVITPASGFWITFGSQMSYYLSGTLRRPFGPVARAITALNNLVCPWLDRIDRRRNPFTTKFTWMYLVVASRPMTGDD